MAEDTGRNHALWLGPLMVLFGSFSYWTLMVRWRALSDFPWLNLLIIAAGFVVLFRGVARTWPAGGLGKRTGAVAGSLVSLFAGGLLVFYVFSYSYGVPDAASAAGNGTLLPAVQLADHEGTSVDLESVARGDLLLVFYRGHW